MLRGASPMRSRVGRRMIRSRGFGARCWFSCPNRYSISQTTSDSFEPGSGSKTEFDPFPTYASAESSRWRCAPASQRLAPRHDAHSMPRSARRPSINGNGLSVRGKFRGPDADHLSRPRSPRRANRGTSADHPARGRFPPFRTSTSRSRPDTASGDSDRG